MLVTGISLPRSQVNDLYNSRGDLRAFLMSALTTVSVFLPTTLTSIT